MSTSPGGITTPSCRVCVSEKHTNLPCSALSMRRRWRAMSSVVVAQVETLTQYAREVGTLRVCFCSSTHLVCPALGGGVVAG
eukprot:2641950-Rhodomonas_salina.3